MLLVGHGSHHTHESGAPLRRLARRLREMGRFAEVRVGLWKEDPHLRYAFDLVESREVYVVPFFTSEGYFTHRVLPRELGLSGPVTVRAGRTIRYCMPVGAHPSMRRVVLGRAREIAPLSPSEEARATLVVLGHGTERHAGSASTTYGLVERLREVGRYRQVLPAFLDQPPRVDELLDVLEDPHVILVPFFMSEGWHVGTTIPEALALSGGRTRRGSVSVWYAGAVGTHPSIAEVVGEIVLDEANAARDGARGDASWAAGEDLGLAAHPETVRGDDAPARVREAREAFLSWIGGAGPDGRSFLQAVILPRKDGRFEVRHVRDRDRDPGELRELSSPEDAADVAARSSEGSHRPLKTSPDLATGWRSGDLRPEEVWEVFAHLYPTAPVHRHLFERGRLSLASFEDTAARQTGMYEGIGALAGSSVATLVDRCCAPERCLRVATWAGRSRVDPAGVPCPEPCSLFVSGAREALDRSTGTE